MKRGIRISVGLAALLAAAITAGSADSSGAASTTSDNPFAGGAVYTSVDFVPLDDYATTVLKAVAPTMEKYLPGARFTDVATNRANWAGTGPRRGLYSADAISNDLFARAKRAFGAANVFIIAVT